jgi:phosphoglucomutase
MKVNPLAGQPATASQLVDIPKLIQAYYSELPDPQIPEQRVAFGTSGHRGSSFKTAFNERHILAIAQAIAAYRSLQSIDGPLFLGLDTHALSQPAFRSVMEVLAANGVQVMIASHDEYTPTPVISHAILTYNQGRKKGLADGIVITPSHNPPEEGGIKYDPPNGGGADTSVTSWIEKRANELIERHMDGVKRMVFEKAMLSSTTHRHDYMNAYIGDLGQVIDMKLLRESQINLGIDPLGGAGVHYWKPIKERYGLNLTIVDETIDSTFGFMTIDWDGRIRMDPSSPYAMRKLVGLKDRFEVAAGCDTDHDRHGIVTKSSGLLPPNHYLSAAIFYLFQHRLQWRKEAAIGKSVVSSQMINRVAQKLHKNVFEAPVGFKWFVNGLFDGSLAFAGEQSAGAVFARMNGSVWTTDKDGITMALLAAEMTARLGVDPGVIYRRLTEELGNPASGSIETGATRNQKEILKKLSPRQVHFKELAGEKIESIINCAPGNGAPIGGIKVIAQNGWFAARPSGTEDIAKIYAESFLGEKHLQQILSEAEALVNNVLGNV